MINLEWLRTFKTIYEKGSMTAAANALFISQPGVSLHLSSLEDYVGHKLFERLPRKLMPTERGKLLYNTVVDPIERLMKAEKNFQKSTREDIPSLTVGMCFETYQITLERHVQDFDFDLILEFDEYRELLAKLDKGIIDLVVTPQKLESSQAEYTPFSQEHIILAAHKDTDQDAFQAALGAGKPALLDWLKAQRWYGRAGDYEHLRRFWQTNFGTHPDFRPNFIVPNIHSIIASLTNGPGLGIVPDFLCLEQIKRGEIIELWRGYEPLTNTLYLARRKDALHPAQLDTVEDALIQEMPALED